IPFGNVLGRHTARRREIASRVEVVAGYRQRRHIGATVWVTHPGAERAPSAAVPLSNPIGGHSVRHCENEISARVEVAAHYGQRSNIPVNARAERAPTITAPLGKVKGGHSVRDCPGKAPRI